MDRDPAINRLIEAARAVAADPTDDAINGLLNAAFDCPVEVNIIDCSLTIGGEVVKPPTLADAMAATFDSSRSFRLP